MRENSVLEMYSVVNKNFSSNDLGGYFPQKEYIDHVHLKHEREFFESKQKK